MLFKTSKKIFAHIDCDAFFASCEVFRNPNLKGKYVCVGHEMIIAASYEAKKRGIKTGTPIWEAKKMLGNQGLYFPVDINYYAEISQKLMVYLQENMLSVEKFSIDEAFCEITGLHEMYKITLEQYIQKIQKEVLEKIGIPVSIGVSDTRIKAKIFSKINKPFGYYISLNSGADKELFQKLPLSIVPFIGKSYQARIGYRAETVYDFIQLGYWKLKEIIGKNATTLWLELCGVNAFVVKKSPTIKSMSRSRSFNKEMSSDKQFLHDQLIHHFNCLYEQFISTGFEMKSVSILLRDRGFYTHIFTYKFPEHTYIRKKILTQVGVLFDTHFDHTLTYRSTGIIFSDFRSYKPYQTTIFDKPLRDKSNSLKLYQTVNALNEKYHNHKIAFGSDLLGKGETTKYKIRE